MGALRELREALPGNAVLLPLLEAMKTYWPVLQSRIKSEKEEGLFLYLPPGASATNIPLQIEDSSLYLFLGKGAKLELTQMKSLGTVFIDAFIGEDAELYLADECLGTRQFSALLKRRASLKSFSYVTGNARQDSHVILSEEGCKADLQGLTILDSSEEAHHKLLVEHTAPSCTSRQHFKSVLRGESRSLFEGKIFVRKEAQKTEAYQLNQNLLLSDGAKAESRPNLEIFADDVKASHGATISQLSEEELFYCQSRGLSLLEAKTLLLDGFCHELLEGLGRPFKGRLLL
jgi:Fe-S cluster assembly protein SufD